MLPEIDQSWWDVGVLDGQPIREALVRRDISVVFRFLRRHGFSRARLAALTGLSEARVRLISQGRQRVTSYEVLDRVATGLKIPRHTLGLGPSPNADTVAIVPDMVAEPLVSQSWGDLLRILAALSNTSGCAALRRPVEGQLSLIAKARMAASGPQHQSLLVTEARWTEFLSWVETNCQRPVRVLQLLDHTYSMAVEAKCAHLAGYALMRKSQQAFDDGDAVAAVNFAQQAARMRGLPASTAALCQVREAEGHALAGDSRACGKALARALRLVTNHADGCDDLATHCTIGYVRAAEAHCLRLLGDSSTALTRYEEVLAESPGEARLDEAIWRAGLAAACLDEGAPERAVAEGLRAVEIAAVTSSARALRAIGLLMPGLRRYRHVEALPMLADSYRTALLTCHD